MITVSWLLQRVSHVPSTDDWLSPSEREVLAALRVPKRCRDWRLGRWTAKRALARAGVAGIVEQDAGTWTRLSVRATEGGAPAALIDEAQCDWAISLSHAGDCGLCTVARRPVALGCDVERAGRRAEEFVIDYFTASERSIVDTIEPPEAHSIAVTTIWSAKESALKALGVGLRLDTREVDVQMDLRDVPLAPPDRASRAWSTAWFPLVVHAPARTFHGWWRIDDEQVMTIVADPAPALPVAL